MHNSGQKQTNTAGDCPGDEVFGLKGKDETFCCDVDTLDILDTRNTKLGKIDVLLYPNVLDFLQNDELGKVVSILCVQSEI